MPTNSIDKDLLAKFVPMSALDESHLRELSNHGVFVDLEVDDVLNHELHMVESTFYLVEGELCMTGGDLPDTVIKATDPSARFALASSQGVGRRARANSAVRLLRMERAKISTLLIWAQASGDQSAAQSSQTFRDEITAQLLQSRLFARIPPGNIERIGQLIEPQDAKAGDTIIRQGESGDHYFIIEEGRCEVLRELAEASSPTRLAELGPGESFGEEALLTDSERNATVRMLTDGVLLKLTRDYFVELISAPLSNEISHERAAELISAGAQWIDVRLKEEFEQDGLEDSISVPLSELRDRRSEFPKDGTYIAVCNSGRRAQAGAFLLTQYGLNACSLRDGIALRRPQEGGIRAIEENLGMLQAELLRANAELDEAVKAKALAEAEHDVEAHGLNLSPAQTHVANRLRTLINQTKESGEALDAAIQRKRELESAIIEIQARETSSQRDVQEQLDQLRAQAQASLESEKQRLTDYYKDASAKLETVEKTRRDAEARFNEERERIEREHQQARSKMDSEAERIRLALEKAQEEATAKAESIRDEHQKLEKELRQRTENDLRHEREHLEEEFSRSITAHELARKNMEQADAERIAAEKEADQLRLRTEEELRQRREREQREREAQLNELSAKSQAAQAKLDEAQRARDEALAQQQSFSARLTKAQNEKDQQREKELRDEFEQASEILANANDELGQAQLQHTRAAQAEQVAEQTQAAAVDIEEELRLQIYEEMHAWMDEEHSRSADEADKAAQYARELERVQAEKEKKRVADLQANQSMLSDIEEMLAGNAPEDSLNIAMRTHTIAEEKARLVGSAKLKLAEQAARARASKKP